MHSVRHFGLVIFLSVAGLAFFRTGGFGLMPGIARLRKKAGEMGEP